MIKPLIYAVLVALFVLQTANVPTHGAKAHAAAHTVAAVQN